MCMRVLGVVALMVVLIEALLAFAFFAGYWWLGGWEAGLLLSGGVLLLLTAPWVGGLVVDYHSDGHRAQARLGWWGTLAFTAKPEREITIRILGIPWRKKLKAREPEEKPDEVDEIERELRRQLRRERRAEALRKAAGDWEEIARLLPSGLQLATDLLCDARELQVKVQAPTGNELADGVIAGIVGHRGVGPIDLRCTADTERRVQVHYHIGLCRAALGALYVAIQGLPWMLKRRAREKEDKGERPQGPAGEKEEEPASPPPAERLRSEAKESE